MPQISIADKPTLDSVNTKVGTTGDAASASGSIFARLAEMLTNRLTSARAAYLDYINNLNTRLTDARAGKLDNLDTLISSRAPSSTALSTVTWTSERALKLDSISKISQVAKMAETTFSTSNTWNTIVNVSGAGYLTGIFVTGTSAGTVYTKILVVVDGVSLNSGSVSFARNLATYVLDRGSLGFFHRFNSSLVVYGWPEGGNVTKYGFVSYILD